jgi:hypothetical protein
MSIRKCFFPKLECHMFYVLYQYVIYLLTVPRTKATRVIVQISYSEETESFNLKGKEWNSIPDLRLSVTCSIGHPWWVTLKCRHAFRVSSIKLRRNLLYCCMSLMQKTHNFPCSILKWSKWLWSPSPFVTVKLQATSNLYAKPLSVLLPY